MFLGHGTISLSVSKHAIKFLAIAKIDKVQANTHHFPPQAQAQQEEANF